jgi:hypothetical protein
MELHVIPVDDNRPHELDTMCSCGPEVEFEDGILVTHNAYIGNAAKQWGVFDDEGNLMEPDRG